jgi:hypothetical protein
MWSVTMESKSDAPRDAQAIYDQLPRSAEWTSTVGYVAEPGFREIFRTREGRRYMISNGRPGDRILRWTLVELQPFGRLRP